MAGGKRAAFLLLIASLAGAPSVDAQSSSVAATVHNLSVSGPGQVKSMTESEICKFCHIPHNPIVPKPLWGHALSKVPQYNVPELGRGTARQTRAPQPDGASRLCLSCHDGTVALGDVGRGKAPIPMAGAQRLEKGRRGFIGTDLSGSHPISFVVRDVVQDQSDSRRDMAFRSIGAIEADREVRLDKEGKMQCTTCHEPHSDRYYIAGEVPRFWVKPTYDGVCATCHELR